MKIDLLQRQLTKEKARVEVLEKDLLDVNKQLSSNYIPLDEHQHALSQLEQRLQQSVLEQESQSQDAVKTITQLKEQIAKLQSQMTNNAISKREENQQLMLSIQSAFDSLFDSHLSQV